MPSLLDWLIVAVALLVGGFLVVLVLGGLVLRHERSLQKQLFKAALRDVDRDRLAKVLRRGVSIDVRDREGNAALHHAYYNSRPDSVELLLALGADGDVLNHDLKPDEMAALRRHVAELESGLQLLDSKGGWVDPETARAAYDVLRAIEERFIVQALTQLLLRRDISGRRVMMLAMKLGRPRSMDRVVELFLRYGDQETAVDFLNSNSRILSDAAKQWAHKRNCYILGRRGSGKVSWGRF